MPADPRPTDPGPTDADDAAQLLWGWGITSPSAAHVVGLHDQEAVAAALKRDDHRGTIARGAGRSYGDPALNAGGVVIDGTSSAGLTAVDLSTGVITAKAGTSIDQLIRWLVPLGWFVPVTPGTRFVTVGGAIAADIHGKNHHRSGSWCRHVESFRLLIADGSIVDVRPDRDPELFWATCGGMGLTGIILDATIHMKAIETSWLTVDTDRCPNLDSLMSLMAASDRDYEYSVAWIDVLAGGAGMGRAVLDRGRFATPDELGRRQRNHALEFRDRETVSFPPLPLGLVNPLTVAAFNEVWYRKAPQHRVGHLQSIGAFFHPLDMVRDWNRVYGPRGCVQWQCVVPLSRGDVIEAAVRTFSSTHLSSFLAVLKLMGPGDGAHLSFPIEGWTLSVDVPVHDGLEEILDQLDEQVAEAGGRLYLAKDARMRPELLPVMYPRIDEWREIRRKIDPDGRFQSDMSRRLDLV
jgi:decaprenylphospho-beta-D-ribofuranose 2-oxidase